MSEQFPNVISFLSVEIGCKYNDFNCHIILRILHLLLNYIFSRTEDEDKEFHFLAGLAKVSRLFQPCDYYESFLQLRRITTAIDVNVQITKNDTMRH
jgi:hypothetical protein